MKKSFVEKVFIVLVALFVLVQFVMGQNELNDSLKETLTILKYAFLAMAIVMSLVYAYLDSKKLFKNTIYLYLLLIPLYAIFKFRGVI